MKQVQPSVYIIAKSQVLHNEVQNWLTDKQVSYNYELEASPGATLTTLAGKECYNAFMVGEQNLNLTKIRTDMGEFCDNILASGHGSVLQHVNYTFALNNVSRVLTAELNRHSAGTGISERSYRYVRPSEFGFWMPDSIKQQYFNDFLKEHELSSENIGDLHEKWSLIECAKEETRAVFVKAFEQMGDNYDELERIWAIDGLTNFKEKKKLTSLFRRIIGMGIATGEVWTGNLRALRHVFTMRCSEAAEEEICLVATLMLEEIMKHEPELFGDFEKVGGYYRPRYVKV